MKILVSNDDGYDAPGILALADALLELGEVVIVAPDRNRSGASSSLTLTQPVLVSERRPNVFSVEGTPADCIMIALGGLIPFKPDLVVSGINDGPNMADDTLYSGTVAAAIEGRFLGIPAIAASMAGFHAAHFDAGAQMVKRLVAQVSVADLPADTILNVNIPDLPLAELKGFAATRLGSRNPPGYAAEFPNPRNKSLYWLGPAGDPLDTSAGTDFHAVENNMVSVTPLAIDMTRHSAMQPLQQWLDKAVV